MFFGGVREGRGRGLVIYLSVPREFADVGTGRSQIWDKNAAVSASGGKKVIVPTKSSDSVLVILENSQCFIFLRIEDSDIPVVVPCCQENSPWIPREGSDNGVRVLGQLIGLVCFSGPSVDCIVEADSYYVFYWPIEKIEVEVIAKTRCLIYVGRNDIT